jgi:hypothetical protein
VASTDPVTPPTPVSPWTVVHHVADLLRHRNHVVVLTGDNLRPIEAAAAALLEALGIPAATAERCQRCQGEGNIANSDLCVRLGFVRPIDCPDCAGSGVIR